MILIIMLRMIIRLRMISIENDAAYINNACIDIYIFIIKIIFYIIKMMINYNNRIL